MDRLVKARRHAGLTQTQIGEALGLSLRTIRRIEKGPGNPERRTLLSWAFVCGVDPDWIANGDTSPQGGGSGPGMITGTTGEKWLDSRRGNNSQLLALKRAA